MRTWHYRYAGLHVSTELPLPEWAAFELADNEDAPEVWIRRGQSTTAGDGPPTTTIITARQYDFTIAGVAGYQVRDGRSIQVWPAEGAGEDDVRVYLLASAWAGVLYQRGLFPLHAGVVRAGGGAVALCGMPGTGKSTATAWLVERGYPLLSDDLCRCAIPADGPPLIWKSTGRLRLTQDSLKLLGLSKAGLARTADPEAKFVLPWSGVVQDDCFALRAIYLLAWGETRLTRLMGRAAVEGLVGAATYHPSLLEAMGLLPLQWRRCMDLVKRRQVWEFARPRDGTTLDAAMRQLIKHWESFA